MNPRRYIILLFFFLLLSGCVYEFPEVKEDYSADSTNVTGYIGIGDGLSAGFMDGALFTNGQQNSLAAILATQFELTGLANFSQPDVSSVNGFNPMASEEGGIKGRWIYALSDEEQAGPTRILTDGEKPENYPDKLSAPTNFAIPFARCFNFNDPGFSGNIYYSRIASDPGNSTLLGDILAANPTFFTLWIGVNDYMAFALAGGTGNPDPPSDPSQIGETDLTPEDVFNTQLNSIVSGLLANSETKGLIAELPMVDDFPFFYTLPYNFMKLSGTALGVARSFYKNYNEAVAAHNAKHPDQKRSFIDFNDNGATLYPQPLVVKDNTLPDAFYPDGVTPMEKIRQLEEGELIFLSLPVEKMKYGLGSIVPVEEEFYLSAPQIELIRTRIKVFNSIIEQEAAKYPDQLAVVYLSEVIHQIAETGKYDAWGRPPSTEIYQYNGVPLTGDLALNSIYSLDGLHFNQRGNAFIANLFIHTMNKKFKSNLPDADVNSYVGNTISE